MTCKVESEPVLSKWKIDARGGALLMGVKNLGKLSLEAISPDVFMLE